MIHPSTELRKVSDLIGHGVFATRFIPKGTIIWMLCPLDRVIPPRELDSWPDAYRPLVHHYCYRDGNGNYVVCWDNARNVNHSCEPNMLAINWDVEIAVRDIRAGEEICCEYGAMELENELDCTCGVPSCRNVVRNDDMVRLGAGRDRQVEEACRLILDVEQPLWPYLTDKESVEAIARGLRKPTFHTDLCNRH